MALNGITLYALKNELSDLLTGGRIKKITQPEKDEILLTVNNNSENHLLFISVNPSLPLIYITEEKKKSPDTAPSFCMMLRKHIQNGRINKISLLNPDFSEGLERVLRIEILHLDEMGDEASKYLYIEIMGKHSNIIFCDKDNKIIDSIKHVGANLSSVREVLPGRDYFIPGQSGKLDPFSVTSEEFFALLSKSMSIREFFQNTFTGFSSVTGNEIAYRASLDSDSYLSSLNSDDRQSLFREFSSLMENLKNNKISPSVYISNENKKPKEFSVFKLYSYEDLTEKIFSSVSEALFFFFDERNKFTNINQKTQDLRKNVATILERNVKKADLQRRQLKDSLKMDKFKLYGELLTANAHSLKNGEEEAVLLNYYTNENIKIPLDKNKTIIENANIYYDKYNKLKRTKENLEKLIKETEDSVLQLRSILTEISFSEGEEDISLIKQELSDSGFIRFKKNKGDKKQKKSSPLHFITDEGFHLYVGKNNIQNDYLTFSFAEHNDWWFHVKSYTGSHVILKTEGKEVPDEVFLKAASLAGYYSSGRDSNKIEIDYLMKKDVKKPNKRNAGFVIYYTNYSMTVEPVIYGMKEVK